jgi:hypothetical protein
MLSNSVLSEKQFPTFPKRSNADKFGMLDMLELHAVARRQDAALEA